MNFYRPVRRLLIRRSLRHIDNQLPAPQARDHPLISCCGGPRVRLVRAAFAIISSVMLAGCFASGAPSVGTISSCDGPGLDVVTCRRIAEFAFAAYSGPALAADDVQVDVWASCALDGVRMIAEAATSGTTCYGVGALGASSGGQRVAEGTFQGGTLVDLESVVWLDAGGKMHAVTRVTPYR
jgi:hypothetical protein